MVEGSLNPLPKLGIKLLEGGILDYVQTEDRKFVRFGFWDKGEKGTVIDQCHVRAGNRYSRVSIGKSLLL